MRKVIHRYEVELGGVQEIEGIPPDAKILHVASRHQAVVEFWTEVPEHYTPSFGEGPRRFQVAGTGHEVPEGGKHVGTCLTPHGEFVWHLYEITQEEG